MVTKDIQPLSVVENIGFNDFVKKLNPSYSLPSRYIVTNNLLSAEYKKKYEDIKKRISEGESICLTTDAWTSKANESYISLTAHFISKDWKLNSLFLNCFKTVNDHTAENLKNELLEVVNKWDIQNKISCVVSDNAANILAAIRNAGWTSLPCFAHTLHLVVIDSLKDPNVHQIITKCKSIVDHFHRSTKATNKLKEMQKQMGKKELKLINCTPTRWNSVLKMAERCIENQEPLEATIALLHKPIESLSYEEWEMAKEICNILQPFDEITVELSAENYTTVSKIIVLVRGLQTFIIKKRNENKFDELLPFIETIIHNLNKRFNRLEFIDILAISTFLDPRFKARAFTDAAAVKTVKEKISSMYNVPATEVLSPEKCTQPSSIWDEFDKMPNSKTNTSKCIIEINNYGHEDLLQRNSDPLKWWKDRENVYPGLSVIAKRFLGIVATSVPSERVFSAAGQVISDRRSLLKSENVEKILFLHFNDNE